jgi:hypothetical protein
MKSKNRNCIRDYIEKHYQGGLIGISDLSDYCRVMEGELYITLLDMQSNQELKIIKRYFCPEFHQLSLINDKKTYCEICDLNYSNNQIDIAVYIEPLGEIFAWS